jgi:glycosyltransferase involved in cell wall biosynthesis
VRIVVVVNSLQQGGAERAAVRLAESFFTDGHQVIIATWNLDRDFYALQEQIKRVNLGNFFHHKGFQLPFVGNRFSRLGKFFNVVKFRRQIQEVKPDVVICMEALVGSIMAISLVKSGIPVIVSERVNPDPDIYLPHKIAQLARPLIYKKAAICSVQTRGFSTWVKINWKVNAVITPNHIPDSWIVKSKTFNGNNKKIVSIGRIEPQKGFDILLNAWNSLGEEKDGWTLEIVGSQNNAGYLKHLFSLGGQNVHFSLPTHEISELLDDSAIFVSSSRFEGFPNVVLEALARGVPTVAAFSTDIVNEWDASGALVGYESENANALAIHLGQLMKSSETLEKLGIRGLNEAKNYTWEVVGRSWYIAIDQAIMQKKWKKR